jgi:two-component sensor histidine kinase
MRQPTLSDTIRDARKWSPYRPAPRERRRNPPGLSGGRERQPAASPRAGRDQYSKPSCQGRHRCQGARGVRQAAEADLEELHHRIKNTLATVGAIVSQSLRNLQGAEHAQHAIEGRLLALGRAHDLLLQARWTSADLGTVVRSATEAFDDPDEPNFSISGPDIRMTSGAAIAVAMTLNELCTNTTKFGALSVPGGVGRHHLDAGPTETALAPYLERDERSDGPPSRKAQLRNTANRDARQATQGRCAVNLCVDRFHVRIRRTNGLCDFVGGISWYSGIAGRVKSCRWFFTRPRSAHNHEE